MKKFSYICNLIERKIIKYGEIIPGFFLEKEEQHGIIRYYLTEGKIMIFSFPFKPLSRKNFIGWEDKKKKIPKCYTQWYWNAMKFSNVFNFSPEEGYKIFKACKKAGWDPKKELKKKLCECMHLDIWIYERAAKMIEKFNL